MYAISPSEADAYRSCKRRHWYGYGYLIKGQADRGIRPQTHSDSLQRGTDGHQILGDYYQLRIGNVSHDESAQTAMNNAAIEYANRIAKGDIEGRATLSDAMEIVGRYFEHYGDEAGQWQPLAAEKEFRIQTSDRTLMAFKPDLIQRHRATGIMSIWDNKFLYNMYRQDVLPIMPQLTKYAEALNRLGFEVKEAQYNILSTRKNVKKNAFVRVPKPLNRNAANRYWQEHVQASIEIADLKDDPEKWADAPRSSSYFNCKNCAFLQLCIAELDGQQGIDLMVSTFYSVNDYRYSNVESSED